MKRIEMVSPNGLATGFYAPDMVQQQEKYGWKRKAKVSTKATPKPAKPAAPSKPKAEKEVSDDGNASR